MIGTENRQHMTPVHMDITQNISNIQINTVRVTEFILNMHFYYTGWYH